MARPHKVKVAEARIIADSYFADIDKSGRMPTISGLALALKLDMVTLKRWMTSPDRGYVALSREMMARLVSYWEPLLAEPKNTSGAQFWLKSVVAWRDVDPREDRTEVTTDSLKLVMVRKEMPPKKAAE